MLFGNPNFFTDKNGAAAFEVPILIILPAGELMWWRWIKKRRIGKASVLTQSYKPIVAQLSVPQFLIAGDSAVVIGKAINYTADQYTIAAAFNNNGTEKNMPSQTLPPNESLNNEQFVVAANDTIKAAYTIETTTGFKDGEERKIPVFKKGTEEAVGNFWVLQNDTTINFSAAANSSEINIYAQK